MNRVVKERLVLKKSVRKGFSHLLLTIIFFLGGMISVRLHPEVKDILRTEIYEKSISYVKGREYYRKYFGNLFPKKTKDEYQAVLGEKVLKNTSYEEDGFVHLDNSLGSAVVSFENGVIIYLDSDKLMIEQVDGVISSYYGIHCDEYKLYDYVDKGDILGVAKDEVLVRFEKNGEKVDYQKYF